MPKKYKVTSGVRIVNRIMRFMIRTNLAPKQMYLLTVKGRKSGKLYSTPVSLVEERGQRFLVAPYGEVGWVKNAYSAGEVSLSRGRKSETLKIEPLDSKSSAPILKAYLQQEPFPRPYFDVTIDSPLEDYVKEAPHHPVFRLRVN